MVGTRVVAHLAAADGRRRLAALLAAALLFNSHAASARQYDPSLFGGLRWRLLGPFRGGRSNGVAGVRTEPDTFYFGAVGGGVWKTVNAGRTWSPVFDSQPFSSIGALAVAPSNPRVVYVGTGEADMRSQISYGNGMYRSTDAGATWTHLGLDDTRQISRVLVDPKNADVAFVAALGHAYGPNAERGVYRTRDGGKTWQKVLFKNPDVGAADLALDPSDSRVVYASLWNTRRPAVEHLPAVVRAGRGRLQIDGRRRHVEPVNRGAAFGTFRARGAGRRADAAHARLRDC